MALTAVLVFLPLLQNFRTLFYLHQQHGYVQNHKASANIWIDVVSYAEGIAGWKTSLLELLYLARWLNGTLVEPCMKSGRLGSCGDSFTIPVSEIFDLVDYMKPSDVREFPLLASFESYQKALDDDPESVAGMVKLCIVNDPRLDMGRCSTDSIRIGNMTRNGMQYILEKSKEGHFVLHVEDYWRGSLSKLGQRFGTTFPKSGEFERRMLPFHSKHIHFVDDLLKRANITMNNFSAIHWRAEKEGMDFMRCAKAVNDVKRIMLKRMTNNTAMTEEEESRHRFVLLSSLNEDSDKMWLGSKVIADNDKESVQNALTYLLRDNGFIKIDDLLDNDHSQLLDPGMLAVYDLIIATKANNFASCARHGQIGCTELAKKLCEECSHVGKFGHLATLIRKNSLDTVGSSWECWPVEENTSLNIDIGQISFIIDYLKQLLARKSR